MGPGFYLPCNSSIVRLDDGSVLLYSPPRLSDELAAAIDDIGPVRHVVAPNLYHHLFAAAAVERYPEARSYAAPGLAEKLSRSFDEVLTERTSWPGARAYCIDGAPKVSEVALYLPGPRAMLCCDFLFNVTRYRGAMTGPVLWLTGSRGKLAYSRFFRVLVRDRAVVAASARRLLQNPIDVLVPAHGDIVDPAQPAVDRALEPLLRHARLPG